ncbi:probable cyclin-dependent serine/threonine-protein kinase DDB_G0292550 [Gordionus sp. m RMFG-2023]|uniref:probable cyclin-dependent serine/threonine-protein kinase DDB_G0292550 n=1 Tax=Gordionus sp. m RMFG-2023 TaxID=3053472 RepID=UPI0031FC0C98
MPNKITNVSDTIETEKIYLSQLNNQHIISDSVYKILSTAVISSISITNTNSISKLDHINNNIVNQPYISLDIMKPDLQITQNLSANINIPYLNNYNNSKDPINTDIFTTLNSNQNFIIDNATSNAINYINGNIPTSHKEQTYDFNFALMNKVNNINSQHNDIFININSNQNFIIDDKTINNSLNYSNNNVTMSFEEKINDSNNVMETISNFKAKQSDAFKNFSFKPKPSINLDSSKQSDAFKNFSFKSKPSINLDSIDESKYRLDSYDIEYDYKISMNRYNYITETIVKPINDSQIEAVKKYRVDMKRIINMIINTLSAHSAHHLIDKYHKLKTILTGNELEFLNKKYKPLALTLYIDSLENSGQKFNIKNSSKPNDKHAEAKEKILRYLEDCVSTAIINQGIKQVESNLKSAFIISPLANALCTYFPHFHLSLSANFYLSLMPLISGILIKNTNPVNYDIALHFNEEKMRHLRGTFQLYLALCITPIPTPLSSSRSFKDKDSHNIQCFYNIGRLWYLIAKSLNSDYNTCQTDVNSQNSLTLHIRSRLIILDCITICGSVLLTAYKRQYNKLLNLAHRLKPFADTETTHNQTYNFDMSAVNYAAMLDSKISGQSLRNPKDEGLVLGENFWG